ncbi:MAG: hypothetical protein Q9179_001060 [Wetmoreana sp. 5 TL-2023]
MASQGSASSEPDGNYEILAQSAHNKPEIIDLDEYDSIFEVMLEATASLDQPRVKQENTSCVDAATLLTRSPPSPPHIKAEASGDGFGWVGMEREVIDLTSDCEEDQGIEQQEIDTAQGNDSEAVEPRRQTPNLPGSQGIEPQDNVTTKEKHNGETASSRHTPSLLETQEPNMLVPDTNEERVSASLERTQVPDKSAGNDNNENPNKNVPESSHHIPPLAESIFLGDSFLRTPANKAKKTPEQIAQLKARQKMLLARFQPQQEAAAANSIFGGFAEASSSRDNTDGLFIGMDLDIDSDKEAMERFKVTKQAYQQKKRSGKNSFEDDVIFGKAQAAERTRRKQAGEDLSASGGVEVSADEAEENVTRDSISQSNPHSNGTTEEANDPNNNVEEGSNTVHQDPAGGDDVESDVVDVLGTATAPNRRRLAKAREQDQHDSMLAGIEQLLSLEKRKEARKPRSRKRKVQENDEDPKPKKPRAKPKKGKGKEKAAPTKGPRGKQRVAQPNNLPNIASIFSSNIFEEANENLNLPAAPKIRETRKDAALKAMLINVPLEDLTQARSEKKDILESTQVLGKHGRCRHAQDGKWSLAGMSTTLFNHQVQGAAWMKRRETGESEPFGGLLSDQMGLGKTLMVLACMVANRPLPGAGPKTTLIVCTASLVLQWEQEIRKHTREGVFPIVARHHAGLRVSGSTGAHLLMGQADIIITTYDEVRKSYPNFKPPQHIVLPEAKRAWWEEQFEKQRDVLHRVHWYRIILDEAQAIKNRDSQTSIACRGLMARHRWAVSATPILNCIEELYPYFKLLRVKYTGDFETFKENFCDHENPDSVARLHAILKSIMMRRTHSNKIMGRPIVTLPENHQETIPLEFNPVERALYDAVKRRFIRIINQRGRNGTLEKSYNNVLTMLLRLRQMTAHPFMLQDTIENLFEVEDIQKLWKLTIPEENNDKASRDMLRGMKSMIEARINPDNRAQAPDSTAPEEADDDFPLQAETSSELVFEFRRFLRTLVVGEKWADLKARSLCHKCRDVPDVPYVTDCHHLYCLECLRALQQEAAVRGEDRAACCECAKIFQETSCCSGIEELVADAATSPPGRPVTRSAAAKRNAEKEDLKWVNFEGEVLPSTKTAATVAQIERWLRNEPEKKIIVFSQFHPV